MKVFLTGGTGFIGMYLAQALLRRGWDVTALVRSPDGPQARLLASRGVRLLPGDVTERESLRPGMTGADLVIHNAAWYELGVDKAARERMRLINVHGADNALSLALELGIPRTVHVSSCLYWGSSGPQPRGETYQREYPYLSFYEQTKAEAHELALGYLERGLPLILVCPAHVMGPNDHAAWGYFLRLYLNGIMPPLGWAPNSLNSGAHVADIAEGIALAAEKGRLGETYLLAGDTLRTREVLDLWITRPGGFRVLGYMPVWLARLMFAPTELLLRMAGMPAFLSREVAAGGGMHWAYSSAKAQRELGWTYRPSRPMWESILDDELRLLAERQKCDLRSRLMPLETAGLLSAAGD